MYNSRETIQDYNANENAESTSQESEPEQPAPSVFERFRKFHRTILGRSLEAGLVAATTTALTFGKFNGQQKEPGSQAYETVLAQHPDLGITGYKTLDNVGPEDIDRVLALRDKQYQLRAELALQAAKEEGLGKEPQTIWQEAVSHIIPPPQSSGTKVLENYKPSIFERELQRMGLGSMIRLDRPFPVVVIDSRATMPVTWAGGKRGAEKEFDPDTILVKPDVLDNAPEYMTSVLQHEQLHVYQWHSQNEEGGIYGPLTERWISRDQFVTFVEGTTELLRQRVNHRLHPQEQPFGWAYPAEEYMVYSVMETIGEEAFWKYYRLGQYENIFKAFDEHHPEDSGKPSVLRLVNLMFNPDGIRTLGFEVPSVDEIRNNGKDLLYLYRRFHEAGLLDTDRVQGYEHESGKQMLIKPENRLPMDQYLIRDKHDEPIGIIGRQNDHIELRVYKADAVLSISSTPINKVGEKSQKISQYPELDRAWLDYQSYRQAPLDDHGKPESFDLWERVRSLVNETVKQMK